MLETSWSSRLLLVVALCGLIGGVQGMNLSQEDAYGVVLSQVMQGNTEGRWVYAHPGPVPAGTSITTLYGPVDLPGREGWLFFIDDAPKQGWAHPCRYVHVDLTGAVVVKDANGPPRGLQAWTMVAGSLSATQPVGPPSRWRTRDGGRIPAPCADTSHAYAVLISGGADAYNNWERYYGDISFMYRTLVNDYGYQDDHISVLMSDGADPGLDQHRDTGGYVSSDPDLDGDGDQDVEYAATTENITAVFEHLRTALEPGDQLFVFTTDHGGPEHDPQQGTNVVLNLWEFTQITDDEFAAEVDRVASAVPVMITMEQCYSGGFVDDIVPGLPGQQRVIATAANAYESSWGDTFSTLWISAVASRDRSGTAVDADAIGDGIVSMREAFEYAKQHDHEAEHPQYAETPGGVGANLALGSCFCPTLVAHFIPTRTTGYAPVTVGFADASTGMPTAWSWTFGDGETSTLRNPSHTYTTTGTYIVNLTVENATGHASGPVSRVITVMSLSALGDAVDAPTLPWTTDSDAEWTVDRAVAHDDRSAARSGAIGGLAASNLSTSVKGPVIVSFWWKVSSETDFDYLRLLVDGVESAAITGEVDWSRHQFALPSGQHTLTWRYAKDEAARSGRDAGWVDQVATAELIPGGPAPAFSAYPQSGPAPHSVRFMDYTTGAAAWFWAFGDGKTSTEQSPTHIYDQSGRYPVTLTVLDAAGRAGTKTEHQFILVTDPLTPAPTPVADFSANETDGSAPMTVGFTDESDPTPAYRWWQFGDGGSSTDANPVHTFTKAGTYTVNLTVWTGIGTATVARPAFITVGPDPRAPVANVTISRSSGTAPLYVRFTDTSTNATSWHWDFGGMAWTTMQSPNVVFRRPGEYAVTLTASNAYGSSTVTRNLSVTGAMPRGASGSPVSVVG
ncbi:PKD domain protein [anaerobic digester metagenome]